MPRISFVEAEVARPSPSDGGSPSVRPPRTKSCTDWLAIQTPAPRLRAWRNDLPQLFAAVLNFGLLLVETEPDAGVAFRI